MLSKKLSLLVLPLVAAVSLQANDPFFNDPFGDDIFKEMYQMQKEMDKVFARMQERMNQRTQLWNKQIHKSSMTANPMAFKNAGFQDKGNYYAYNTQIPKNDNNQIDVSIENGILHLTASIESVQKTEKSHMKMQQHSMYMIQRSETLPVDADVNSLKGSYENGFFVITLQKKKAKAVPSISIKPRKTSTPLTPKGDETKKEKSANTEKVKTEKTKIEKKEGKTTKIKVSPDSSNA